MGCTEDELYTGRVVQRMSCTEDELYRGRVIQRTSCTQDEYVSEDTQAFLEQMTDHLLPAGGHHHLKTSIFF